MVAVKRTIRAPKSTKEVKLTNSILDISLTIGFLGANIIEKDIKKLYCLFRNIT